MLVVGTPNFQVKAIAAKMEERMTRMEAEMGEMGRKMDKEEVGRNALLDSISSVLSQALREQPYLMITAFRGNAWTNQEATVTFDRFLTNQNNADMPGGADGQLDLKTGVFTCMTPGYYTATMLKIRSNLKSQALGNSIL